MSPLALLLVGLVIVVGGILALRLHAFLALILGAFAVALLTPDSALRSYASVRVEKGEFSAKAAEKFPTKAATSRVADEFVDDLVEVVGALAGRGVGAVLVRAHESPPSCPAFTGSRRRSLTRT